MTSKIILITGCTIDSIGYHLVQTPCQSGNDYTIILTARKLETAQKAIDSLEAGKCELVPMELDIESDASMEALAKGIQEKYGRLDVLWNNAGVNLDIQAAIGKMTVRQAMTQTNNINVVGTHLLTLALVPLLLESETPRLAFTSSEMGSLAGTEKTGGVLPNAAPAKGWPKKVDVMTYPGFPAYRGSKAALDMIARDWARVLKEDGVKVHIIDPGLTATKFAGGTPERATSMGAHHPSIPAKLMAEVIEGQHDDHQGVLLSLVGVRGW